MTKEYVSVKGQLDHLNNVLARLKKAADAVEAVQEDLHIKKTKANGDIAKTYNDMLEKTGEHAWRALRMEKGKPGKKYSMAISYNTFGVRASYDDEITGNPYSGKARFKQKIEACVGAISDCKTLFKAHSVQFDKDGSFDRTQSVVSLEAAIASRIAEVESYVDVIRKGYDDANHVDYSKPEEGNSALDVAESARFSSLAEIKSSFRGKNRFVANWALSGLDLGEGELKRWINQLCDEPTLKQRYNELTEIKKETADKALFEEVVASYKSENDQRRNWTDAEVMYHIQKELDQGKRVFINIKLNKRRDLTTDLSIAMWTTVFSTVSTMGESVLGAYSFGMLITATGSAAVVSALGADPYALAATIGILLCIMVVNQSLFDNAVNSLLNMLRNMRIMKNPDGSWKTPKERAILGVGVFFAVASGAVMAALTFNACQSFFSSILSSGVNSPIVVGIALAIAAVEFFALTGFNFQFFYSIMSNMNALGKKLNRMFFRGRNIAGKVGVFMLYVMMSFFYVLGSLAVGYSSLKDIFTTLSSATTLTTMQNAITWIINAITIPYYLASGVAVNNKLLMALRVNFSKLSDFFKYASVKEIFGRLAAYAIRFIIIEPSFLVGTFGLVLARTVTNVIKMVFTILINASVVTGIPLIGAAISAACNGTTFKKALGDYVTAPQKLANAVNKKMPGGNWLYREARQKCELLSQVGNAASMAAVGVNSANSVITNLLPAGPIQYIATGCVVPLTAERYIVSHSSNASATDAVISTEQLDEAAETLRKNASESMDPAQAKALFQAADRVARANKQIADKGSIDLSKRGQDYSFTGYFKSMFSNTKSQDTANEIRRLVDEGEKGSMSAA